MVTAYFLDTSALAKRYMVELGTDWIQSITTAPTQNPLFLCQLTWVELHSAIARRQREQDLTPSQAEQLLTTFQQHWDSQYYIVRTDESLIQLAANLVKQHPLRAYDAIQLASALTVRDELTTSDDPPLICLSADDRLLAIAQLEGLSTLNPNRD
ncbi:MAG: type II toxin-antitoxin system VapC family toxin [Synechococcales cyanobacterium RM1_1_8]|nr:type II toxin-antitoxin system VapC family toxin [Synechococcales cyanobacterium RM1_1_8]